MFDMKKATLASLLLAAASLALMSGTPVAAQSASASASSTAATARPIPRMADGHPDMSGVWWPGHDLIPAQASAVYREGERQGIGAQSCGSLYKPEVMAKAKTIERRCPGVLPPGRRRS